MARLGRGLRGRRAGRARDAAALLAAARGAGRRGLCLAVADGAWRAQRPVARLGLGDGPFCRRVVLDSRSLLRPAGRLCPAWSADRGGPGGGPGLLPWAGGRRIAPCRPALARPRRPLQPPDRAGDRLGSSGMAARAHLHRLSLESARSCLGVCHAFATGCRAVRRLWAGHGDLSRARRADGRLVGIGRGAGGGRDCGLRRPRGDGARRRGWRMDAHCAAQCAAGREMARRRPRPPARQARGNESCAGLRPSRCRGLARNGAATDHRTGVGRAFHHGHGRAAGRLSHHGRGARHGAARRRRLEFPAGRRPNGRHRRHIRQGPSRAPGRVHPVPQAARTGLRHDRPRLLRGGRGARYAESGRPAVLLAGDLLRGHLPRSGHGTGCAAAMAAQHHQRCLVRTIERALPTSDERAAARHRRRSAHDPGGQHRRIGRDRRLRAASGVARHAAGRHHRSSPPTASGGHALQPVGRLDGAGSGCISGHPIAHDAIGERPANPMNCFVIWVPDVQLALSGRGANVICSPDV